MTLALEQKYNILLEALHAIGGYEPCDCGCPNNRKPRVYGTGSQIWVLANLALQEVGEEGRLYETTA